MNGSRRPSVRVWRRMPSVYQRSIAAPVAGLHPTLPPAPPALQLASLKAERVLRRISRARHDPQCQRSEFRARGAPAMQSRRKQHVRSRWSVLLALSALTWLILACSGAGHSTPERSTATPASAGPVRSGTQSAAPAAPAQADGQPYIERVETATTHGNAASDGNGWGGNISRIVRTSNGDIYTTVVGDGPQDYYHRPWYIVQRSAATGQWQMYTAPGSAGNNVFNPPNIVRGPNDELYVMSWPNDVPYVWSSVTNTDTPLPGSWYQNPTIATGALESTYGAAGIDSNGDVVFTQSSPTCSTCYTPDKPGSLNWAYRSPSTQRWQTGTF